LTDHPVVVIRLRRIDVNVEFGVEQVDFNVYSLGHVHTLSLGFEVNAVNLKQASQECIDTGLLTSSIRALEDQMRDVTLVTHF